MANEKWKILFFPQHSSLITLRSPAHSTSQARHYRDQLVGIDWLGNVSAVTGHYCLHAILDSRVSSQRHGGNALIFAQFLFANSPDQFVTIDLRHADIANQQIEAAFFKSVERIRCISDAGNPGAVLRQLGSNQIESISLVVDEQNLQSLQAGCFRLVIFRCRIGANQRFRTQFAAGQWQSDSEDGATTRLPIIDCYGSTMKFNQMTNDRQPKSEAAVRAGSRAIALAKSLEHVRDERGVNTWSCIFNLNLRVRSALVDRNLNFAALWRKFRRV